MRREASSAMTWGLATTRPSRGVGGLVVVDLIEAIEIVGHHAGGFAHAARRRVGEPIQPFETGTVAEVEMRDRIEGALAAFRLDEVVRRQLQ